MVRHKALLTMAPAMALGLAWTSAGMAKAMVMGPFSDLRVALPLDTNGPELLSTYNGCHHWGDIGPFEWLPNISSTYRFVRGVVYLESPTGNFEAGKVTVTTIFGVDLNPGGADLAVTGYTPGAVEVDSTSHTVLGATKSYPARSSALVAIGDLSKTLGKRFDLSPFQGDPASVVRVYTTIVPGNDTGQPLKGVLRSENFASATHVSNDGGSFGAGFDLPGTQLFVTGGNVDVLGVKNGTNGQCLANPTGNCLDLIGDQGFGSVQTMSTFNLDPAYTYTIQFSAVAQDVGGSTLDFTTALGAFSKTVTATGTPNQFDLTYTPAAPETAVSLSFTSLTNIDGLHGPVLSAIVLCSHPVGSKKLTCPVPPP